ncbi:MAG: hypothetical protein WKF97_03870 [Chitinophagaceae bacterium]
MIKFKDLQIGGIILAEYEGQQMEGVIKDINRQDNAACVETDVQEFWFKPDDLHAIPLSEEQLMKLNFEKKVDDDSSIKYIKGAFRVFLPEKDNFSRLEIWYREDRRHLHQPISVHELQNHYLQMTKVNLSRN